VGGRGCSTDSIGGRGRWPGGRGAGRGAGGRGKPFARARGRGGRRGSSPARLAPGGQDGGGRSPRCARRCGGLCRTPLPIRTPTR
jgi:hypothetical protein